MLPQSTRIKLSPMPGGSRVPRLMLPVMKMPLVLYRLGLGWLLGHRFMRLTHVGRKSGKLRHTVLLVLRYDPRDCQVMVISAWEANDWFRNIHRAPALQVETGRERFVPEHRDLSVEEITVLLDEFRKQHRLFSRLVCRIPGWTFPDSEQEVSQLAHTLRGVAFRPR